MPPKMTRVLADDVAGADREQRDLFFARSPTMPLRPLMPTSVEIAVERLATERPSARAVPLGASFLKR